MLQSIAWGNQWDYWKYFDGEVDDHRVMFDGPTKTIWILEGISEIFVKEHLYSDWKEWISLYDHTKYPQAFETEGGRPISATERLGDSYLLINDWTIRQRDSRTTVNVIGNLYAYDSNNEAKDPYGVDPYGGRSITSKVSSIVNTISPDVSGIVIDYNQVASAVWNAMKISHTSNGTMGQQMSNIPTTQQIVNGVWDESATNHRGVGSIGEQQYLTHEESKRSRQMATNNVEISRIGSGVSQVDMINVYDDDGITLLYTIKVTGEDADNREVTYTKPY